MALPNGRRPAAWILLAAVLAGAGCATGRPGEESGPPRVTVRDHFRDYGDFVSSGRMKESLFSRPNVGVPVALAATAALWASGEDERLQERLSRHPFLPPGDADSRTRASDIGQVALIAAPFVVPLLVHPDDDVSRAGYLVTAAEASIYTLAFAHATKALVGRDRPGGGRSDSFVSGHASGSFMGATLLYREYGWKAGIPAYLAAGAVGIYRVESDHHFPGDVLAGAALGTVIANLIYDKNLGEKGLYRRGPAWTMEPIVEPSRLGMALTRNW